MIYTFNLMVELEPNGVDVAQAYRGQIFRKLGCPARFVFTQVPPRYKWDYYLSLGYAEDEIILAHMLLTDQRDMTLTMSVEEMKQGLNLHSTPIERDQELIFPEENGISLVFHRNTLKSNYVDYVDYYVAGHLLRREHYGSVKLYTEYFTAVPTDAGLEARVFQRLFYNLDGSVALEEIKKTPGDLTKSVYRQGTHWFYSESELLSQAIGTLQFSAKDHIIVDRLERLPFTQTLLKMKGEATLSCALHSIHHWGDCINSEYFLLFQYANYFDHIIVSTEAQKEELERDLSSDKPVSVLPVGGLERLQYSDNRKPYSLMIAARFERRKRLDLAIDAVVALHEKIPEVTLDIYGQGMLWQEIEEKIKQLNAQSYIHLKGHQDLQTRFKAYELYLATSEWETFGLTLLEAIGSGLVMVGTDVPYGNPTFIKNGRNGFLVPFVNQSHEEVVADLKRSMQKAFGNLNFLREGSYKLAERYMTDQIIGQWREFLTNRGKNNDVLSDK